MITIFKNRKDIPGDMEYVELNDLFFNQNTVSFIDKQAEKIIEMIDGSKLISKYKIYSRFLQTKYFVRIIKYIQYRFTSR